MFVYNPAYYLAHPQEILFIWKGGLASHGGAIGIVISTYLFDKKFSKKGLIWVFDRLVIGIAVCGAMIRLGNLMNSEIYGGSHYPALGFYLCTRQSSITMHPTQIYEAIYCLITFGVTYWLYWKREAHKRTGLIFGVFLIGIFLSRFFVEFIKNNQESFEEGMLLNMGQLLSIPFIIWGIWLIFQVLNKNPNKNHNKQQGRQHDNPQLLYSQILTPKPINNIPLHWSNHE